MFCKYCGTTIDTDSVFCPKCGQNQNSGGVEPAPLRFNEQNKIYQENNSDRPSISVGFFDAIKNYYSNFFNFSGRTVRSEFLWSFLYTVLAIIVIRLVLKDYPIINTIWTIVHIIPDISIRVRCLHDIGKSGWNYLLNLIPIIGPIILIVYLCKGSSFSDNIWGLSPYNIDHEYDEKRTWKCEKCGCRTPNSYLTCKNCGATKPSSKPQTYKPRAIEQSKKCVCGERVFGKICPNCGREIDQVKLNASDVTHRWRCDNCGNMISTYPCIHCGKKEDNTSQNNI